MLKTSSRYLLGVLFVAAGVNHFVSPAFYVGIMPTYVPWHPQLVFLSGIAEVALGGLLLFRRWAAWAGWGLVVLLVAIFPANVHMALHPELYPSISPLVLWLRLPLQAVFIAWAWCYTRR